MCQVLLRVGGGTHLEMRKKGMLYYPDVVRRSVAVAAAEDGTLLFPLSP